MRAPRWVLVLAVAGLSVTAATACTPGAADDRTTSTPTSAATAPAALAPLVVEPEVAQMSVVTFGVSDPPDREALVKVLPEVVATGGVQVGTAFDDFWLMVDPQAVASWSGISDDPAERAWTTTKLTQDGAMVGMVPAVFPGVSEPGSSDAPVTRWHQVSVAPGASSLDAEGPAGGLVFPVTQRDDESLAVLGLALLDGDRNLVAFAPVEEWAGRTDPGTF